MSCIRKEIYRCLVKDKACRVPATGAARSRSRILPIDCSSGHELSHRAPHHLSRAPLFHGNQSDLEQAISLAFKKNDFPYILCDNFSVLQDSNEVCSPVNTAIRENYHYSWDRNSVLVAWERDVAIRLAPAEKVARALLFTLRHKHWTWTHLSSQHNHFFNGTTSRFSFHVLVNMVNACK